uniref:Uncharacterized protein n=1 Tax=Arundo donax TaxID=35708 RepID=A0A0A9BZ41_ARUDO
MVQQLYVEFIIGYFLLQNLNFHGLVNM